MDIDGIDHLSWQQLFREKVWKGFGVNRCAFEFAGAESKDAFEVHLSAWSCRHDGYGGGIEKCVTVCWGANESSLTCGHDAQRRNRLLVERQVFSTDQSLEGLR